MKIHVNRVPPEGLQESASYDPATLDVDRLDVHVEQPVAVPAFVTKAEHELVVQAQIHCVMGLTCARCLKSFDRPLKASAMLTYDVVPTDVVDITDNVRQELILGYPMVPICDPGCKGLCLICGENLNVASCEHHTKKE